MKRKSDFRIFQTALLIWALASANAVSAQGGAQGGFQEKYLDLFRAGKLDELKTLLKKWEKAEPKNPEMFIAWFNYYCQLDSLSYVAMGKRQDGAYGMYPKTDMNAKNVHKGITYLDKSLINDPNRLDIYMGKISVLIKIQDFKDAGDAIIKLLEVSAKNGNKWLWSNNTPVDDGEHVLLKQLEEHYLSMIYARSVDADYAILTCTEEQMKIYPDNNYASNLMGVYYIYHDNYPNALRCFLEAEKIDGEDEIVRLNIGRLYAIMEEKENARQYLDKLIKTGAPEIKEAALNYIDVYNLN